MAIVQNPVTGRSKNAFANAIFTTILGKNVMRSRPLSVANPRTQAQQNARLLLALLSKTGKRFAKYIERGLSESAVGMYPRNLFTKLNGDLFGFGASNQLIINPEKLIISKGALYPTPTIISATTTPGTGTVLIFNPQTTEVNPSVLYDVIVYDATTLEIVVTKEMVPSYQIGTVTLNNAGVQSGQYAILYAYNTVTGQATDSALIQI